MNSKQNGLRPENNSNKMTSFSGKISISLPSLIPVAFLFICAFGTRLITDVSLSQLALVCCSSAFIGYVLAGSSIAVRIGHKQAEIEEEEGIKQQSEQYLDDDDQEGDDEEEEQQEESENDSTDDSD